MSPAWWLLLPIAVGASVMGASGAPPSRSLVQLASGVAGALLAVAIARIPKLPARAGALLAVAGALAIAAPLVFGADIEGVRRWVELGAYRVHPSMLLTPALLVFAASTMARRPWAAHALLLSLQTAHVISPDAGQVTAAGLAAITLSVVVDPRRNAWVTPVYAATIAFGWLRPDPLGGAPFVEDIFTRAFALSPIVGAIAVAAMGASALCPLLSLRGGEHSTAGRAMAAALAAYFVALAIVPCVGEFPVPLLGFGASPVIGAFLGVASLERARKLRRDADALARASTDTVAGAEPREPHARHRGRWLPAFAPRPRPTSGQASESCSASA
ncbi:MAG: hypothetical protein U0414_16755 [Polyangiaceae bacterium]